MQQCGLQHLVRLSNLHQVKAECWSGIDSYTQFNHPCQRSVILSKCDCILRENVSIESTRSLPSWQSGIRTCEILQYISEKYVIISFDVKGNQSCFIAFHPSAVSISHHMMTSSDGNIFRVTGLLCGEFIGDRWRRALMFSLICALNKRLSKQSWGCWFETPTRWLWRHCNESSYNQMT